MVVKPPVPPLAIPHIHIYEAVNPGYSASIGQLPHMKWLTISRAVVVLSKPNGTRIVLPEFVEIVLTSIQHTAIAGRLDRAKKSISRFLQSIEAHAGTVKVIPFFPVKRYAELQRAIVDLCEHPFGLAASLLNTIGTRIIIYSDW